MDIRFVSSLTPEDEAQIAAAICGAVGRLLDPFALMYTLRIVTTDGQLFHHQSCGPDAAHVARAMSTDVAAT
jgi:hypothetical protein